MIDLFTNLPTQQINPALAALHDKYGTTRFIPWHVAHDLGVSRGSKDDRHELVIDGGFYRLEHRDALEVLREKWTARFTPSIADLPTVFGTPSFARLHRIPYATANLVLSMLPSVGPAPGGSKGQVLWIDRERYRDEVRQGAVLRGVRVQAAPPPPPPTPPRRRVLWGPVISNRPRRVIWASA